MLTSEIFQDILHLLISLLEMHMYICDQTKVQQAQFASEPDFCWLRKSSLDFCHSGLTNVDRRLNPASAGQSQP